MTRVRLAAAALVLSSLIAVAAAAQAPPIATIGLYVDSLHADADASTSAPFEQVEMWVWCRPGVNGMMCAEFALEFSSTVVPTNLSVHPDVSVILGAPATGASICFLSCRDDWTWACRQTIVVMDGQPASVRVVDHPTAGMVKVATCLELFPIEPAVPYPDLCLNQSCPLDVTPPMHGMVSVTGSRSLVARFSEILFPYGMDDPANYLVYETGWPDSPIEVVSAERSGGGDVALLELAIPLVSGVGYTLRASNLVDMAGYPLAGSPATFMGQDADPPTILSASVSSESLLVLVFSEPLEPAMAEEIDNYSITPAGSAPVPAVGSAHLRADGWTVDLAVSPGFEAGESYLVRADDVVDLSGNPVGPNGVWFSVDDLQPPGVLSVRALSLSQVEVVFTEPIDPASGANVGHYRVYPRTNPSAEVPVSNVFVEGATARLVLGGELVSTAFYTLAVSGVEDLAGNPVPPGTTVDFTVGDITPPRLMAITAEDYTTILACFNEPMDSASIAHPANFTLFEYFDPSVEVDVVAAEAAPWEPYEGYWCSRLTLADSLVESRRYTLRAEGVTDEAGLEIDPEYDEKWFVMPERDRPSITDVEALTLERVRVTFSEMMGLGPTMDPASYGVWERDDSTVVVPVDSVYPGAGLQTFDLVLGGSLDATVWYTLSAAGAEDIVGNEVGPGREVDFHPSDHLPPMIDHAVGAGEYLVDVVFSEPVEDASATEASNYAVFHDHNPSSELPVTGAVLGPDTVTVTLTLGAPLWHYSTYTVSVSNVRDLVGREIAEGSWADFVWPDTTAPAIDSVEALSPSRLLVWFDEPVSSASAGETENWSLAPEGAPADSVPISSAVPEADGFSVTLELGEALAFETPYRLGAPGVEDRSGNPVGPENEYVFALADVFPPTLDAVGADSDSSAVLYFDEILDGATASDPAHYAVVPSGLPEEELAVLSASLLAAGDRVRLVVDGRFERYVVYVAEAVGVEDLEGNPTVSGTAMTFVLPDSLPPAIVSAGAVSRTVVDVVFDERMDPASLAVAANYRLAAAADTAELHAVVAASPLADPAAVRLTVETLEYGVLYRLTVSDVVDLAGNPIVPGSSVEFTALDTTPPELVSVGIVGATGLSVRFSEPVDTTTAGDPSHYAAWMSDYPSETIAITSAVPSGDRVSLTLAESPAPNVYYTLSVTGVEDRQGNVIVPDSRLEFRRVTLPPAGYVGLFLDGQHTNSCFESPGGFIPFDMWVWCLPSDRGMMCAEFMISYPQNVIPATVTDSPLLSVYLGSLATGMSACLSECSMEWTWLFRQTCYLTDMNASSIRIVPHPDVGVIQFANCDAGYPLQPCYVMTHLYLNDCWLPGTLLESFDAAFSGGGIELTWTLSEIDDDVSFVVSRAVEGADGWTALDAARIERNDLVFTFVDREAPGGASYVYRVACEKPGADEPRVLFETEPVEVPRLPLALGQNRPNPFNPATEIRFRLPSGCPVRLDVFDVSGRLVATLVDRTLPAGEHVAAWDGRDARGKACSSGIYFYRLAAGKERLSKKMVLLR